MKPDVPDPGIFTAPRSLELLRHVAEQLLPRVDMDRETRSIAYALIQEEIDTRLDFSQRRLMYGT